MRSFWNTRNTRRKIRGKIITLFFAKASLWNWDMEDKEVDYDIKWKIRKKAMMYKPGASYCDLCISEKVEILLANPKSSLNKRTEILEKCRHRHRFKLGNIKT